MSVDAIKIEVYILKKIGKLTLFKKRKKCNQLKLNQCVHAHLKMELSVYLLSLHLIFFNQ